MFFLMAFMIVFIMPFFSLPLTAKAAPKAHKAHTGSDSKGTYHEGWTPISSVKELMELGENGGSGYLTADIVLNDGNNFTIYDSKNVNLCLNGHSISQESDDGLDTVSLNLGSTLNLYDVNNNPGRITHNPNVKGTGVYVYKGNFIMNGGTISGNKATVSPAVYVNGGKFVMNDGNISENHNIQTAGGAVGILDGDFLMNGGAITNNDASSFDGGGVYLENSTFTMTGGDISYNGTEWSGGGIYSVGSTIILSGGNIEGNSSDSGGGVTLYEGSFTMTDGNISENYADGYGGGILMEHVSKADISGGTITGNYTVDNGGGIFIEEYSLNLSGGIIKDNTAEVCGGGVYVQSANFNMTGGTITGNEAPVGGGLGISNRHPNEYFIIEGGTIKDNTASENSEPLNIAGSGLILCDSVSGGILVDENYSYIKFNQNTGTKKDYKQFYKIGGNEVLTANRYTRSGYKFYNWNTKSDGSGKTYKDGAKITNNPSILYAQWKPTKYTVTFDPNGGTGTMSSQKIAYNTATALSKNTFTKEGYAFAGWNTKANGSGTSYADCESVKLNVLNTNKITLYAQWENAVEYKVNHYKQKLDGNYNKTPNETETLYAKAGTTVTPEVKNYTGFTSPSTKNEIVKEDGSTVVEYFYERKSYTLTWDFDGGNAGGKYTSGSVKYGEKIVQPVPLKKGYVFDGWNIKVPDKMPAKNLKVKALWREAADADYATVNFNANQGLVPKGSDSMKVQKGFPYGKLPEATRLGYTFSGWYTAKSGGTKVTAKTVCEGDITLYAHWKAALDTKYVVEHYRQKVDGSYPATANETESLSGKTNSSVTPEVKTYKGFTAPAAQTVKISADGKLAVKYYYTRNSYMLTWDFAGGSASGTYTKGTVKYGAKITAPVPVREGYVFNGWDKTVPEKMPANDVTYKAKWRKPTNEEQVRNFVGRFYTIILERPAEEAGLKDWTNKLLKKEATGAQVAAGFINSDEFQKKKMTDEEYVTKLYRAFFDREPDKGGYDGWLRELKNGKSRDEVLRGFIGSPEFNNLCKKYGINTGSY